MTGWILMNDPQERIMDPARPTSWKRTLYVIVFAQVMTSVGFSSFFPFLPLYVAELGADSRLSVEFLAGLAFSGQAVTMMIASPIWGMVADRYGRKLMVERAMFGGAVVIGLMAFARSAEELVLLRAIQGLITGVIGAHNALVASVVPRERTGYAMGLLQVGLGIGVALGPLIGGLVADLFGYRSAFYVTSLLLFISGIVVWLGIEEDFQPRSAARQSKLTFPQKWNRILSAPGVLITYSLRFISQFGRMMIYPILPFFIQSLMNDPSRVNTFTGIVFGTNSVFVTLSAIYLGRLGDRIGHRIVLICCFMGGALAFLPQGFVAAPWQLLVLQAMAGATLGGIIPSISALLARYTPPGEEGVVYGLDNSITAGARALAPLLGASVAVWMGLRTTFMAICLLFFMAGILSLWRLPREKASGQG
jgi:DHA1 family multidrug resistance protein-like MFS transporter